MAPTPRTTTVELSPTFMYSGLIISIEHAWDGTSGPGHAQNINRNIAAIILTLTSLFWVLHDQIAVVDMPDSLAIHARNHPPTESVIQKFYHEIIRISSLDETILVIIRERVCLVVDHHLDYIPVRVRENIPIRHRKRLKRSSLNPPSSTTTPGIVSSAVIPVNRFSLSKKNFVYFSAT